MATPSVATVDPLSTNDRRKKDAEGVARPDEEDPELPGKSVAQAEKKRHQRHLNDSAKGSYTPRKVPEETALKEAREAKTDPFSHWMSSGLLA